MRSGSGSQPVSASRRSASLAMSPFFRWSMSSAARLRPPSRTASRMRLGHAAEIVADRRPSSPRPPCRAGRRASRSASRQAASSPCWLTPDAAVGVRTLIERVDAEADAMGEQLHARWPSSRSVSQSQRAASSAGHDRPSVRAGRRPPWPGAVASDPRPVPADGCRGPGLEAPDWNAA
jgi:hypothetical protein